MSEKHVETDAGLTDLMRNAMILAVTKPDDSCAHNFADLFALVDSILMERQAQAWDEGHRFTGYEPECGENPYRHPIPPAPTKPACQACGVELSEDGACWWCDDGPEPTSPEPTA